jgi:tetratricopeptide (TPR) repeat protein
MSSNRIETELERTRGLLRAHKAPDAAQAAAALVAHVPENRDALHLLAVAERHRGRLTEALLAIDQLITHHPGFSRAYQERGLCYVAQRDASRAIEAFLHAVNINPALPTSWRMLANLYRMAGDHENQQHAEGHVSVLSHLAPEVIAATDLFSDGETVAAEQHIRAYLVHHNEDIEALRLLARIAHRLDVLDDAEALLATVLARSPAYVAARVDYVRVLLDRHKFTEARGELDGLLANEPDNRVYRTLLAAALAGIGDHASAIELYRRLTAEIPAGSAAAADLLVSIGHSLKTLGRTEEAIASYWAAAESRPDFGDAYWSLANLKTYRFTYGELATMEAALADEATSVIDQYHLCFALGKGYEDAADYRTSYSFYERGNALKRTQSRYSADPVERNTANQRRVCTSEFFKARTGFGVQNEDPIFIIGLPRAGSTLIEQILASHSQVEGTQELADIPRIALELQGPEPDLTNPRYPEILTSLSADDVKKLAQRYLRGAQIYRTGKPRFIDKMPNNFRHIGLIHLMFPRAKIIDARREPMACCFSIFKQLFAKGQEFAYSLEDVARYYRTYLELMEHWNSVLPNKMLRVLHEDVVDDVEGATRRILAFCGLDFEESCLSFFNTKRAVRTASSEQVRRPINRDGIDQWRHYEPWLWDLRNRLGDALIRYRN